MFSKSIFSWCRNDVSCSGDEMPRELTGLMCFYFSFNGHLSLQKKKKQTILNAIDVLLD